MIHEWMDGDDSTGSAELTFFNLAWKSASRPVAVPAGALKPMAQFCVTWRHARVSLAAGTPSLVAVILASLAITTYCGTCGASKFAAASTRSTLVTNAPSLAPATAVRATRTFTLAATLNTLSLRHRQSLYPPRLLHWQWHLQWRRLSPFRSCGISSWQDSSGPRDTGSLSTRQ